MSVEDKGIGTYFFKKNIKKYENLFVKFVKVKREEYLNDYHHTLFVIERI